MAHEFKQLDRDELKTFEKETLPFHREKTLRDGTKIKPFQYNEFMRYKGAMKFDGVYWIICNISEYMRLDDALDQLSKARVRREYAKKKELEERAQQHA